MAAGKATATEHSVIRFSKRSTLPAPLLIAQHTEQQHENGIQVQNGNGKQVPKLGSQEQGRFVIPQVILAISSEEPRRSPMTRGQVGNQALLLLVL